MSEVHEIDRGTAVIWEIEIYDIKTGVPFVVRNYFQDNYGWQMVYIFMCHWFECPIMGIRPLGG